MQGSLACGLGLGGSNVHVLSELIRLAIIDVQALSISGLVEGKLFLGRIIFAMMDPISLLVVATIFFYRGVVVAIILSIVPDVRL